MTGSQDVLLGLFPLALVLVPGEVIPLHIFEERYQKLIAEHLEEGEFGLVLAESDGLRECGCTARVTEVLERLDEGRMTILVEGGRRFRILEVREPADPVADYLSGLVELYDDTDSDASPEIASRVLEVFRRMLHLMDVENPRDPTGEGPLSFRIAAAVDFGATLKQELLESVHEEQRLEALLTVLITLLPRLELRKERAEAIRGNGKGH